ncbi:MAG: hypothetical protein ABI551_12200 [Polyangiaceae bacterium]
MTTLKAGPLKPSPALRRVLAVLGALSKLDTEAPHSYRASSHGVRIREVADWEKTLDIALPNDALLIAALGVPLLEHALGKIADSAEDVGVDDDAWTRVWTFDPNAMHPDADEPTYQQGAEMSLCLARDAKKTGDPKVLLVPPDGEPTEMKLSAFLKERLATHFEILAEDESVDTERAEQATQIWKQANATPASDKEVDALYGAALEADTNPAFREIRIMHPKLGAGRIVGASVEGENVEVVFDSGDRKRIKRSFLQEA